MAASPAPGCPPGKQAWLLNLEGALSRRRPLARRGAVLRTMFDDYDMLRDGDALDQRRLLDNESHLFSRNRRFLVNLFRNKRRRVDRFWKRAEFARYLPERLLWWV